LPIYEFSPSGILALKETAFSSASLQERRDLQRLLREQVEVIAPDTLVISEEFGEWKDSRRRIDLLGLDTDANLVVIELKRAEDGGHMELQAIRYASMVSTMTFDRAVEVFGSYLSALGVQSRHLLERVKDESLWV
jgi:RecB family endonuclease NucS